MDWLKLGVLLLQVASSIIASVRERRQFTAGEDAQIAKESQAILRKTEMGKKIMEDLAGKNDGELDDVFRKLGGT